MHRHCGGEHLRRSVLSVGVLAAFVCALLCCFSAPAQQDVAFPPPGPRPAASTTYSPAGTVHYIEKEMFVPVPNSFPRGLDVLEIYAERPGRHPLVLLTHGTSNKEEERQHVTPWAQAQQALWFARRGYVAIVIARKGYGHSGGERDGAHGACSGGGSFREAGDRSAEDLRQVAKWASTQPGVDAGTIVSAGVSTGGFAQVALSADPPPALKAAISFAGGRGGDGKEHNCDLGALLGAFHEFGKEAAKHGSLPMLWIYAQNDHWFPAQQATQFEAAYQKGGGLDQFVLAPPDGEDGHHLYSHVEAWSATVETFLRAHNLLPLGDEVLPPPAAPNVPPPSGLHEKGEEAWKRFLAAAPYKAFAMTGSGSYGYSTGMFGQQLADDEAMDRCRKAAGPSPCQLVARGGGAK